MGQPLNSRFATANRPGTPVEEMHVFGKLDEGGLV